MKLEISRGERQVLQSVAQELVFLANDMETDRLRHGSRVERAEDLFSRMAELRRLSRVLLRLVARAT